MPPNKKTEEETLEGTTVLCTIPSADKTKPSYYHSFGTRTANQSIRYKQPGFRAAFSRR